MPLPWPAALAPEGVVLGLAMALAGALVGAWIGARLAADRTPSLRAAGVLAAVAIFALTAYALQSSGSQGLRGTVLVAADGNAEVRVAARDVELADRDLLAGRRAGRRPAARGLPRRLPHDRADAARAASGRR